MGVPAHILREWTYLDLFRFQFWEKLLKSTISQDNENDNIRLLFVQTKSSFDDKITEIQVSPVYVDNTA